MISSQHVYEVHPRKDHRGVDLISDALPFGLAILPPFTEHFALLNHEKTYLAVAAFDNPRGDACDRGNEVADPRSRNSIRLRQSGGYQRSCSFGAARVPP
jgi:hypothetical protein